jgi:c-di-GMP-binding flagellar brake protein YcgR
MTFSATDRRAAHRFSINCAGELASGNALAKVRVLDISLTGCGVELIERSTDLVERFGATGLLSLQTAGRRDGAAILPVVMADLRIDRERRRARYGLVFRRLTSRQTRRLISVLDELLEP